MKVAMLLLAGGQGTRLNASTPKPYVELEGVTLVERSATRMAQWARGAGLEGEIILAVDPQARDTHVLKLWDSLQARGVARVVDGGATRQASMLRAHEAASRADLIVVHDAARPFFSVRAATELVRVAADQGAALLAAPLADTLKRAPVQATGTPMVESTVDRRGLWLAQTPQAIRRDIFDASIAKVGSAFEGTDDVSMVEHAGFPVAVVESSPLNFKITRPGDLQLAAALLATHGEDFADAT